MSISSSRVSVTASPSSARSGDPSNVAISRTRLVLPEPATRTRSPTATDPETTVPEKPRKSALGRLTHCTGKRNGEAVPAAISTDSRWSSRLGPRYQDSRSEQRATLSPWRAESGIARTEISPSAEANAEKSVAIRLNRSSAKPTRSILLTASTRWRMPSRKQMKACRLVCARMPLRASTRITASSQLDAPVAMLRVYCSWPGVSATMKARLAVAK